LASFNDKLSSVLSNYKFDEKEENPKDAQQAWQRLLAGNQRFASGNITEYILHLAHEVSPARRQELGLGQHPFVVILTCSDSRVSPELIFDQGLGDLFVVRTAGNVPDNVALGSIEYGLLHLKAPLLVVLGHSKCGAVTATLDFEAAVNGGQAEHKSDDHSHIGYIVEEIKPSASVAFKKYGSDAKALPSAVKHNARAMGARVPALSEPIKGLIASGAVSVITAVYDIDTGLVKQV